MSPQENAPSPQQSLEQKRAAFAWKCISRVGDEQRKEYSALAKSAHADIQINGLGQVLAFWRAKGYEKGKPKGNAHSSIYAHVSEWLGDKERFNVEKRFVEEGTGNTKKKVEKWVLNWLTDTASTDDYRRATSEAIAFLIWLKRFAEAELDEK